MKTHFEKHWTKYYVDTLKKMYPNINEKDIKKFIEKKFNENVKKHEAQLHNNYAHKAIKVDLVGIYDWFYINKPIAAGFGVFFRNHSETINPPALMLDKFLNLRKQYKSRLADFHEDSYDYAYYDRMQLTEKINANSFYGAGGAPTSDFYNVYTATSITSTGQSLISTTETAFEAFLGNNILFIDLDECFNFFSKVLNEKKNINDKFIPIVTPMQLYMRIKNTFMDYKPEYDEPIIKFINRCTQSELKRLYYKNNIYEFTEIPKISNILKGILENVSDFKDPNKIPKEIKEELNNLWKYYSEFVHYNHFYFNRIQRLKHDKRKVVVVVDTDSNMLNLFPWVQYTTQFIDRNNIDISDKTDDALMYIQVNIMSYILTKMITDVLTKYTKYSNVPKEYRPRINMKNEFLFTRLILSNTKKRYASSVRLREGKEILPEKIDVKGLDFNKSSTRKDTKDFFMKLLKEKMLQTDNINVGEILKELRGFENKIRESLEKGEKNFLLPDSVKEIQAYDKPYSQQGVRGVLAWNFLYPDNAISLPEKVDKVKLTLDNEKEYERLKELYPDIYKVVKRNILEHHDKGFADKGLSILAIPKNVETPEWIVPFIDYDTIVNDNVSRFYSLLRSLGIDPIEVGKKNYFTNILNI